MKQPKKVALLILDGWGINNNPKVSAIEAADTPFMDYLSQNYPRATLCTSGEPVGLPAGQMGNSEVGHLNIGAGRVVYQELLRIDIAVRSHTLDENPTLLETIRYVQNNDKTLHLMGLVSDGGVHSHINHLEALCHILHKHGLKKVFIHLFTDGRDTDPKSGYGFVSKLQETLNTSTGQIASIVGRYYAMDRDKRWERVKLAYDLLTAGKGKPATNSLQAIADSYAQGITDEFIQPIVVVRPEDGSPIATLQPDDAVLCFNFRTDRCRQITQVLTQKDMPDVGMYKIPLHYVTMTRYDDDFRDVQVIFEKDNLADTLGEVLEKYGKKQIRIAETEKYPHVTFFFSGGREEPFVGEERIMIPSPKVATYDLKPDMSANELTAAILPKIKAANTDFICLNFANTDMVGHTGVFAAAVTAAQTVDKCLAQIVPAALEQDYDLIIIADHGNADIMVNPDGSPNTAHTTNPVPILWVSQQAPKNTTLKNGKLADIAPTILQLMGITPPLLMDGKCLLVSSKENPTVEIDNANTINV